MLGMRRVSQWDGHAAENMFGGELNLKKDKIPNVMHVCFPNQKKKIEWLKIKSKTHDCFQWIQSVIISLRFCQASMASLKDKKIKVDN